ncbi:MAG: magnesium/cobalt transporter CorA [Desulfobulbus sp.]|nr:magnesium/cobalt transporter CorA [Desulfobulbus sp.]
MTEAFVNPSEKMGLPPGTLVHVGKLPAKACRVTLIRYTADLAEEFPVENIDDILSHRQPGTTLWIQFEGLDTVELLTDIGLQFDIHPLVLEDILNTHQRPKFEEHRNYCFVVLKTLACREALAVQHEQISLLLFEDMLLTFRERADNLLDNLRQRVLHSKSRIRTLGSDYMAYAVMDTVVDNYFTVCDTLEETIESIEMTLLDRPQPRTFATIQLIKRELIHIRKVIAPLREVLLAIQRSDSDLIHEKTQLYFRDIFDHTLRVIDTMDSYRDLINGMLDIYMSIVSNRMNEIMKVLTIFATIFIPLTFLVGVYGMNFEYMPELRWRWSYPVLWLLFFLLSTVLLIIFKKKRWW